MSNSMKVVIEIGHLPIGLLSDTKALAKLMLKGVHRAFDQRRLCNEILDEVLSDTGKVKVNMVPTKKRRGKHWDG